MSKFSKNKGFALLYALLLSGAVLTVGVILMNIITKQLVFSSLNRESEVTYYYLANSGRECLSQAKSSFVTLDENFNYVAKTENVPISCFGQSVDLVYSALSGYPIFEGAITVNGKPVKLQTQINPQLINDENNTIPSGIITKYQYVAIAEGYSGAGPIGRTVKRSAVYVEQ